MGNIKTAEEIRNRMIFIEEKIEILNYEINKQLELPFFQRKVNTCAFLDVEKKKYTSILTELKWILNE